MRPKIKYFIATPFLFAFAGLILWSYLTPRDWAEGTTQIAGRVWTNATVTTPTATMPAAVYYVTEQDRAFRERIGTSSRRSVSSFRTIHYTQYRLQSRLTPGGELKSNIITANIRDNSKGEGPQIMGPMPEGLWIFQDGPVLCRYDDLKALITLETLRQRNPDIADKLPDTIDGYRASGAFNALVVKTKDLQFYVVDGTTGKMSPADRAVMEADTGQANQSQAFYYLSARGCSRGNTSVNDFLVSSFLTAGGEWLGLLSEDKRAALSKWARPNDRPTGEEWRQLYKVPFKLDNRNEAEIDPAAVKPVGSARFLNGAFLMRTARRVWDVADPSSTIVLHKQDIEQATPWNLARLTRDGQVLYDVSSGIADLHTITDAGNTLVLYGFKDFTEPTYNRPHLLVFVDPATGKTAIKDASAESEDK